MENTPLSPHIQIYKWHISSLVSISHRITGIINFFAITLICIWFALMLLGENNYKIIKIFLETFLGKFILIGITWSFSKGFGTGPTPLARQAFERLSKLLALERMTTPPAGNNENKFEMPSKENKSNTSNNNASGPKVSFTAPEAKLSLDISNIEVRLSADAATNVNRSQSEINADKQELKDLKARAKEIEKQNG